MQNQRFSKFAFLDTVTNFRKTSDDNLKLSTEVEINQEYRKSMQGQWSPKPKFSASQINFQTPQISLNDVKQFSSGIKFKCLTRHETFLKRILDKHQSSEVPRETPFYSIKETSPTRKESVISYLDFMNNQKTQLFHKEREISDKFKNLEQDAKKAVMLRKQTILRNSNHLTQQDDQKSENQETQRTLQSPTSPGIESPGLIQSDKASEIDFNKQKKFATQQLIHQQTYNLVFSAEILAFKKVLEEFIEKLNRLRLCWKNDGRIQKFLIMNFRKNAELTRQAVHDEKKGFNLNVTQIQLLKQFQQKDFFTFQDKTGLVLKVQFKFIEDFKKINLKIDDYLMQAEVQELVRMKKSIFDELDSVTEMQNHRNIKIFQETNLSYYNSAMHNNNKVELRGDMNFQDLMLEKAERVFGKFPKIQDDSRVANNQLKFILNDLFQRIKAQRNK